MKRFIIVSSLILFSAVNAIAGGRIDSVRYLTSTFGQNWFIPPMVVLTGGKGRIEIQPATIPP